MVFSSFSFLFYFLPAFLLVYFLDSLEAVPFPTEIREMW